MVGDGGGWWRNGGCIVEGIVGGMVEEMVGVWWEDKVGGKRWWRMF